MSQITGNLVDAVVKMVDVDKGNRSLIRVWLLLLAFIALGAAINYTWWSSASNAIADESSRFAIDLTIAPPILLADGTAKSAIYVQIIGPNEVPRLASKGIEISLVSSDPLIVSVAETIQISPGKSYAVANLTTTYKPGTAVITAFGGDFSPATAEVQTVTYVDNPTHTRLVLYASPQIMLPNVEPPGQLSIALLDENGQSIPATEDLNIVLSSSDPRVVQVADRLLMSKGEYFASANLEPSAVGSATISAIHPGYHFGFVEVNVVEPGDSAEALVIYPSPPILQAGNGHESTLLIIQAVDDSGTPVYFPCSSVTLASSAPLLVEVLPETGNICDSKSQYSTGIVAAGHVPGTATISAVSSGMRAGAATLDVQGQLPDRLMAYVAPRKSLSIEATPGYAVVQVLDTDGIPIRFHGDISVTTVGDSENLNEDWVIENGGSFVAIKLRESQIADQNGLWFVNGELKSAHLALERFLLPTNLQVDPLNGIIHPLQETKILVRAESEGLPLSQSKLQWSVTNGTLRDASPKTDENGEGSAIFSTTDLVQGLVEITAEKTGYEPATTDVSVSVSIPIEDEPGPKLFGIFPVRHVFIAGVLLLVGYVGTKLSRPLWKNRFGVRPW